MLVLCLNTLLHGFIRSRSFSAVSQDILLWAVLTSVNNDKSLLLPKSKSYLLCVCVCVCVCV